MKLLNEMRILIPLKHDIELVERDRFANINLSIDVLYLKYGLTNWISVMRK